MINRELIRLKVVQLSYAYYMNGNHKLDAVEKELFFSLSKAYDLYMYLLELMVEVNRMAERSVETAFNRYRRLGEGRPPSTKFIENKFIAQLQSNHQLLDFEEVQKKKWSDDEDFVRRLYKLIAESDLYKEWMEGSVHPTYDEDRNLWKKIFLEFFVNNEDLDQLLEEKSLYWNDDRYIVDSFVLKTIKQFDPKNGANQELLPEYRDDEDREFAKRLFRASLLGADTYRNIISQFLRNWDIERLAFMDLVILQTALAEILTFMQIPIEVSINEYVELAKYYSTPQSGRYINGILDAICRKLIAEGKLKKSMSGHRSQPDDGSMDNESEQSEQDNN